MNRLSPLITRRVGVTAIAVEDDFLDLEAVSPAASWLDDLKLFATGWIGGLIFFGTLLG